jgi:SAM-dependent methyltransferase
VKSDDGLFNDTAQFTDTSTFTRDYQRYCNARIGRELPGGQYLLDVASGAIPHAEYLEFSRGYKIRICVDFSIRALREARAKLGEDGLYLLSDITRLPLASDIVDTVISLHTIYHVPKTEQTNAVDELVRVTKSGGRIIIVYTWATSIAMDFAFGLRRWLGRIRHALRPREESSAAATSAMSTVPPLYFSPQDYAWYAREVASRHRARLKVWSAVSMTFQTRFFSPHRSGRMLLAVVKGMEDYFPWLCGRFGQYPMFVISKSDSFRMSPESPRLPRG